MMEKHYDFYHTKKPKKCVCNKHNKYYVYKKSYDEHLHRDHSDGNYRFVCDYCGKGFFHRSEFSIHRDSVLLKRKDYVCNKCQQRAFTSIGHLNAHLDICGKEAKNSVEYVGKCTVQRSRYLHTYRMCIRKAILGHVLFVMKRCTHLRVDITNICV